MRVLIEGFMAKRKVLLSYLLLMLFVVLPLPAWGWSGKVIGVDAGDTITVLRGEQPVRIRLYGIDCPDEGQPFGTEAKQFTSTMVFGKMVEVGAINIDHYGHYVKHFTKFAKMVRDYRRSIRHRLKAPWGAWGVLFCAPGKACFFAAEG